MNGRTGVRRLSRAWMVALLVSLAVRPALAQNTPEPRVLREGALVRVRLTNDSVIVGRLVVPFSADSARITVCPESLTCARSGDATTRSMSAMAVRRLDVRARGTGAFGYFGLYLGMLTGALYHGSARDPNMGGMLIGGVAGSVLGGLLGSRTTTWMPVMPCIHLCGWGQAVYP